MRGDKFVLLRETFEHHLQKDVHTWENIVCKTIHDSMLRLRPDSFPLLLRLRPDP